MKLMTFEELIAAHPLLFKGEFPRIFSHLPAGWSLLVDELCTQIEAELTPNELIQFRVDQIKEKFGTLRFYFSGLPLERFDSIQSLVEKAEERSAKICDRCGAPAKLHTVGFWYTLCNSCEEDRNRIMKSLGRSDGSDGC